MIYTYLNHDKEKEKVVEAKNMDVTRRSVLVTEQKEEERRTKQEELQRKQEDGGKKDSFRLLPFKL
jgi:hypothetical protein